MLVAYHLMKKSLNVALFASKVEKCKLSYKIINHYTKITAKGHHNQRRFT
jgi:hypothetical protein